MLYLDYLMYKIKFLSTAIQKRLYFNISTSRIFQMYFYDFQMHSALFRYHSQFLLHFPSYYV